MSQNIQEQLVKIGQQIIQIGLDLNVPKQEDPNQSTTVSKELHIPSKKKKKKKTSRAGFPKGVSEHRGRYEARLYNPNTRRTKYLKSYRTIEEAAEAIRKEASKLGLNV